jgi:hypothetical protein
MRALQATETQLEDAKARRAEALETLTKSNPDVIIYLAEWLGYQREVEVLEKLRLEIINNGKALTTTAP